jgi:hypothetical protein
LKDTEKYLQPRLLQTNSLTKAVALVLLKCQMMQKYQKAIAELNGGVVEGRNINVTEARPREEKSNNNNNKRSFSNNNSRW